MNNRVKIDKKNYQLMTKCSILMFENCPVNGGVRRGSNAVGPIRITGLWKCHNII